MNSAAAIDQRDAIKRCESILAKMTNAVLIYLDPGQVVATLPGASGFSDKQRAAAIEQVQATALAALAPTKSDSLGRTLQTINRALAELEKFKREAWGLAEPAQRLRCRRRTPTPVKRPWQRCHPAILKPLTG